MSLPSRQEWLFAVRTFAAAIAALWIAMWLDLPRPYWAMATVYIASQSFAGATASKAVFRTLGTIGGGLAALLILPALVNAPLLLSLAFAVWVGGCLILALLDRTPRGYAFMLAGYSVAIIGFPAVNSPETIFDTVLARVEEILVGIACATLAATLIFPRAAGPALAARVSGWLEEADAWALDALAGRAEDEAQVARRRRLGAGVVEIETLGSSLGWDPGTAPSTVQALWALRERLLLMLPILSSIDDRVAGLQTSDRAAARPALEGVGTWLTDGASAESRPDATVNRLASIAVGRSDWGGLLLASLALRLRDLLRLRSEAESLRRQVAGLERPAPRQGLVFVHDRDGGMAALSAIAAAVAVLLCCAGWIITAWPDGAVAAQMAAVVCSFFAQQHNPVPAIVDFLRWSALAVIVDGVLLFAVLPQATSFEMLVLGLAPVYIFYGLLMARPGTARIGIALAANGASLLGLQSAYSADFASFANSAVALLVGMSLGAIVTALMRSVGAEWSVRRLQRANWADMADAARGYGRGDRARYATLLLDRIALVATRLSAAEPGSDVHRFRPLAHIRVGLNLVELREGRHGLPAGPRLALERALDALGAHFETLARGEAPPTSPALEQAIDTALAAVGQLPADDAQRAALQGLVGVRRGLCPTDRPALQAVAA